MYNDYMYIHDDFPLFHHLSDEISWLSLRWVGGCIRKNTRMCWRNIWMPQLLLRLTINNKIRILFFSFFYDIESWCQLDSYRIQVLGTFRRCLWIHGWNWFWFHWRCPSCFRWSTCCLRFFSWLLDPVIYLKLRKKLL